MEDSHRRRPEEVSALRRVFQAPEWGLVAGIVAVLAVIYFLDASRAFFSEYSRQTCSTRWRCSACSRSGRRW